MVKRYVDYKDEDGTHETMVYDTEDIPEYSGPHDEVFDLIHLIEG